MEDWIKEAIKERQAEAMASDIAMRSQAVRERQAEAMDRERALRTDPMALQSEIDSRRRIAAQRGVSAIPSPDRSREMGMAMMDLQRRATAPISTPMSIGGFNVPSPMGLLFGGISKLGNRAIYNNLQTGAGNPIYDETGRIVGSRNILTGELLSGRDPYAVEQYDRGGVDESVEPNPVTGQCPAGYEYSQEKQACVPVFASQIRDMAYESYTRPQSLLDQPSGLLDINRMFGQPMSFNYPTTMVRKI